ncbi:MAG: hypothetical protein ACOY0T_29665 [Myxococcota bacterium]
MSENVEFSQVTRVRLPCNGNAFCVLDMRVWASGDDGGGGETGYERAHRSAAYGRNTRER